MLTVLCKCYWNKFFLIIVQGGEPDSSDVIVCQRTGRQTATSFILRANHDSQPACHEHRAARAKQQHSFSYGSVLNNLPFTRQIFSAWEKRKKKTMSVPSIISRSVSQHLCSFCPVLLLGREDNSEGATAGDQMSAEMRRFIRAVIQGRTDLHSLTYQSMTGNQQRFYFIIHSPELDDGWSAFCFHFWYPHFCTMWLVFTAVFISRSNYCLILNDLSAEFS